MIKKKHENCIKRVVKTLLREKDGNMIHGWMHLNKYWTEITPND